MTPIPVEDWSGNIAPSEFALKKRGVAGWDWTNELLDEILVVTLRLYPFVNSVWWISCLLKIQIISSLPNNLISFKGIKFSDMREQTISVWFFK